MKKVLPIAVLGFFAATVSAQVHVRPHMTKDGTFVQGYERTAPNSTKQDNYSTQGNVNPYTGQAGTVNPYAQPTQPAYQAPQPAYGQQQRCGTNSIGQYLCR